MKKRMSKKGQDSGVSPLVYLAIGLVVIVVTVVAIVTFYNYITGKIDIAPKDLTVISIACNEINIAAGTDLYCRNLYPLLIKGEEQLVTCYWLKEQGYITMENIQGLPNCDNIPNYIVKLCEVRETNKYPNINKINGQDCDVVVGRSCKGTVTACADITGEGAKAKCDNQDGCKWDEISTPPTCVNKVIGTEATACTGLTLQKCGQTKEDPQYGCEWAI